MSKEKPADQIIRPSFYVNPNEFFPPALGPTLADLLEKRAQGTLKPGDIAGYLAVELALAEMREETRLPLPSEAVEIIAEALVAPAAWAALANRTRAEAVRPRNETLQDRANALYSPEVEATKIAEAFLADPALRPLLVLKNADGDDKLTADGKTSQLMGFNTLRKILAKRHERR